MHAVYNSKLDKICVVTFLTQFFYTDVRIKSYINCCTAASRLHIFCTDKPGYPTMKCDRRLDMTHKQHPTCSNGMFTLAEIGNES
jgi:hypothetical protein